MKRQSGQSTEDLMSVADGKVIGKIIKNPKGCWVEQSFLSDVSERTGSTGPIGRHRKKSRFGGVDLEVLGTVGELKMLFFLFLLLFRVKLLPFFAFSFIPFLLSHHKVLCHLFLVLTDFSLTIRYL